MLQNPDVYCALHKFRFFAQQSPLHLRHDLLPCDLGGGYTTPAHSAASHQPRPAVNHHLDAVSPSPFFILIVQIIYERGGASRAGPGSLRPTWRVKNRTSFFSGHAWIIVCRLVGFIGNALTQGLAVARRKGPAVARSVQRRVLARSLPL